MTPRESTKEAERSGFEPTNLCEACKNLILDDKKIAENPGARLKNIQPLNEVFGLNKLKLKGVPGANVIVDTLDFHQYDELPHLPRLTASAEAGCHFCGLLRTAISHQYPVSDSNCNDGRMEIAFHYIWLPGSQAQMLGNSLGIRLRALVVDLTVSLHSRALGFKQVIFLIEAPPGTSAEAPSKLIQGLRSHQIKSGDCADWLQLPKAPWPNSLCRENISMIQKEIDTCVKSCSCETTEDEVSFLPTRLINLKDPENPHLVIFKGHSPRNNFNYKKVKYAALSYCWGPPEDAELMLKTTKESLQSRLSGIAHDEMPLVFRDAISVCGKLAIPYLWIDALCIVQDDEKEWQQEASQMGKVYENAFVTIVPSASQSCKEGFVQRSRQTFEVPFRSTIRQEIHGEYYLRQVTSVDCVFHLTQFIHYLEDKSTPWGSRGWTFQEEALSRRILRFGQSMVSYDCPKWRRFEVEDIRRKSSGEWSQKSVLSLTAPESYTTWNGITGGYVRRDFRYRNDIFPAISDMAQRFAKANKDKYVAGLWRGDLFRGLLWNINPEVMWEDLLINLAGSDPYIAPSWSWASRASYIEQGVPGYYQAQWTDGMVSECTIITINIDLAGSDPFGAIRSAKLSLLGKLAPLPFMLPQHRNDLYAAREMWEISTRSALFGVCTLDWITQREERLQIPDCRMMMLLIASWRKEFRKDGRQFKTCAYGLILLPTDNNENEYYRVGIVCFGQGGDFSNDPPWNNRFFRSRNLQTVHLI